MTFPPFRVDVITKRLNRDFWGTDSATSNSRYVGSYGRGTRTGASDIDLLFELPWDVFRRYDDYRFNGQSSLLQAIRSSISQTYSATSIKGDGQIVSIPFSDGTSFEVLPAFRLSDDSFCHPNANQGGSWKMTDPISEIDELSRMDRLCNGNLKKLCKMARAWRDHNNVDVSGIVIDVLAYNFLKGWKYSGEGYIYYDWMSRDYFKYVASVNGEQSRWMVFGSDRYVTCQGYFRQKAGDAYRKACDAISSQDTGSENYVNATWREVYGPTWPYL